MMMVLVPAAQLPEAANPPVPVSVPQVPCVCMMPMVMPAAMQAMPVGMQTFPYVQNASQFPHKQPFEAHPTQQQAYEPNILDEYESASSKRGQFCAEETQHSTGELNHDRSGATSTPPPLVDVVLQLYDAVKCKKFDEFRSHFETHYAHDTTALWPETGREIRGQPFAFKHVMRIMEDVPDIQFELDSVNDEGDGKVRMRHTISGTAIRSHSDHPFFVPGRTVKLHVSTLFIFDDFGRIAQRELNLHLPASQSPEPCTLVPFLENALAFSVTSGGSKALLYTVENADLAAQTELALQFKNRAWDASGSPYGNHILQKLIVRLPSEKVQFIIDAMAGRSVLAAQHRERSRVLQRLIEHCSSAQMKEIVDEVVAEAHSLRQHPYGNFILQSILEHGSDEQRTSIAQAVIADAQQLAKHKISSNVVRAALVHGIEADKLQLLDVLAGNPRDLTALSHHRIGSFVAREVRNVRATLQTP